MLLLDTNVLSEAMRSAPSEKVLAWLDRHGANGLFLSTITVAEIAYGLGCLPDGNRQKVLEFRFLRLMSEGFAHRILPFDEACAQAYGGITGLRKRQGRPMSVLDGQIAAVAIANGYALATRNIKDFESCGLDLVNPFVYAG
ncbi:MAG: type II toxin-antitoxin system VapC family toxin [Polyangiaceae bacterium]|nr:type II toxin-antitoxin system VapC family toxin [Polyangiaceae bacterium]